MRFRWDWTPPPESDPVEQLRSRRNLEDGKLSAERTLAGMDDAIERIIRALQHKEPIVIFGDDDPDGVCSTYILFDYLQRLGSHHHYYYIRNRLSDPHGIHDGFIEHVQAKGYKLVITVDGGSSSFDGVRKLNELGVDTIITDHHMLPDGMPEAVAIVNPQREGTPPHLKHLAGAGVSWLLTRRMGEILRVEPDPGCIVWAAVGTMADKAPLIGYNRTMCQQAIDNLFHLADPTLKHLLNAMYVTHDTASRIHFLQQVFKLVSSGRADNGENHAMQMMLANKVEKGKHFRKLVSEKQRYDELASMVIGHLRSNPPQEGASYFLLHDDHESIPHTLCSLAASYVTGTHKIPALVLKERNGDLVCEARSTDGLNLVDAFHALSDLMIDYGGHARAAGFTLKPGKFEEFSSRFDEYVRSHTENIASYRRIKIDAEVQPKDINDSLLDELKNMMPFGSRNPEPVFLMRNVRGGIVREVFQIDRYLEPATRYDLVFHVRGEDFLHILDINELQ